jgi:hypothetical protein
MYIRKAYGTAGDGNHGVGLNRERCLKASVSCCWRADDDMLAETNHEIDDTPTTSCTCQM